MREWQIDALTIVGIIAVLILFLISMDETEKKCAKIDATSRMAGETMLCVKKDGSVWSVPNDHKE